MTKAAPMSHLLKARQDLVKLCHVLHCAGELLAALDAELPITLDFPYAPDEGAEVLSVSHLLCWAHHQICEGAAAVAATSREPCCNVYVMCQLTRGSRQAGD